MEKVEEAHVPSHCFDDPSNKVYWRQFRRCSDGYYVIGIGDTKELAELNAERLVQERENYLKLSYKDRLKIIIESDYIHQNEMIEAIRIIGKILIGD